MSRLDELIAPIAPERRAAIVARLEGPFVIQTVRAWLAREEIDACWVLADWCRREIASLPRFGWSDARHMATISATVVLLARLGRHVDAPAVWLELVAAVPSYKPMIGRGIVDAMPDDAWTYPPIRRALASSTIPHRRLLATRLQRSGTLDAELAVTWLADPTLRPLAETFLAPALEAHEQLLRDRLEDAKPSEREAIVRLLRRIDPKLSLSGTHDTSTDGELQARLRENPVDEITAEVWADSLIDRHDPRGEAIALELALRRADPERALELSGTLAAFVAANRKALWNKPGGFPFREKYRGRTFIAFGSDWSHTMRGKVENMIDRVQQFVETVTDVRAPRHVFFGRRTFALDATAPAEEPSELAVELVQALGGDAAVFADRHTGFVRRDRTSEPIADVERFHAIAMRDQQLTLHYEFQLAWPETGVVLPHQEAGHYQREEPLRSSLRLYLAGRDLDLHLDFPFESERDPRFLDVYDAICETLGRVMTPSRWRTLSPSADGKKMVGKSFRFSR